MNWCLVNRLKSVQYEDKKQFVGDDAVPQYISDQILVLQRRPALIVIDC